MPRDADEPLSRPYRTVRRLTAGSDAPWPGMLVRLGPGESRVLVEAAILPQEWAGWDAAGTGHLLAPLDVVRRPEGHDVSLPVCPRRAADFLERRRAGRVPLSPGESVTFAVSVLRGLVELGGERAGTAGEWWLTDAGRPVLATGVGEVPAREASLALLDEVSLGQPDPQLWHDVRLAVEHDEGGRGLVRAEERLFAWSAAAPLADASLAPVRSTTPEPMTADRARRDEPFPAVGDTARGGLMDRLVRHLDADLADLVSASTTGLWRRLRVRPARGRGRPWVLAGIVVIVVVAAGVLWPSGAAGPVAADAPATNAGATAVTAVDETPAAASPAPPTADLATLTADLLTARTSCAGVPECLAGHVADPSVEHAPGAIDAAPTERVVTLVDEFGGVAVLRVESVEGAQEESQLVVIQREEDRWLLRDVYVAQQP